MSLSPWILVDDFESDRPLEDWANIDVQNETEPYVRKPQIVEIRSEPESGNHYMLRKPAAEGVIGNRKAIGFLPLPERVPVGETWTFYTRINVGYFPNNHFRTKHHMAMAARSMTISTWPRRKKGSEYICKCTLTPFLPFLFFAGT